jgi:hypothetical protein
VTKNAILLEDAQPLSVIDALAVAQQQFNQTPVNVM